MKHFCVEMPMETRTDSCQFPGVAGQTDVFAIGVHRNGADFRQTNENPAFL